MLKTVSESLKAHWARWLLGAAMVLHLLMMGSLFWGYLNPLFSDSDTIRQGIDVFAIYEAGRSAIENRSVYYWDPLDTSVTPYHTPYRYLPAFAYVYGAPLNAVPPWWVYWGWVAFYELVLVANAYATWRFAGRGTWALVAASMWFVFTPFYVEQHLGQFNFLMATALFWIAIALMRGPGGCWGITVGGLTGNEEHHRSALASLSPPRLVAVGRRRSHRPRAESRVLCCPSS